MGPEKKESICYRVPTVRQHPACDAAFFIHGTPPVTTPGEINSTKVPTFLGREGDFTVRPKCNVRSRAADAGAGLCSEDTR